MRPALRSYEDTDTGRDRQTDRSRVSRRPPRRAQQRCPGDRRRRPVPPGHSIAACTQAPGDDPPIMAPRTAGAIQRGPVHHLEIPGPANNVRETGATRRSETHPTTAPLKTMPARARERFNLRAHRRGYSTAPTPRTRDEPAEKQDRESAGRIERVREDPTAPQHDRAGRRARGSSPRKGLRAEARGGIPVPRGNSSSRFPGRTSRALLRYPPADDHQDLEAAARGEHGGRARLVPVDVVDEQIHVGGE